MTTTISLTEYNKLLASHAELTEIRKREAKIAEDKFKKAKRNYELNEKSKYSNYKLDIRDIERQIIPQPKTHYDWDIAGENVKLGRERDAIERRYLKLKKVRENRFYNKYADETQTFP